MARVGGEHDEAMKRTWETLDVRMRGEAGFQHDDR